MTAAGIGGMARSAPRVPPKQRGFAVIFGDRVLLLGLLLLPGHGDAAGTRGKGVWFVGGWWGGGVTLQFGDTSMRVGGPQMVLG